MRAILGMSGWKTYVGLAIIGISAITDHLGMVEVSTILRYIGGMLTTVGVAHKIEKIVK